MTISRRRALIVSAMPVVLLLAPDPAYAVFGEEDWLSGQNELLAELIGDQLRQISELVELVNNTRQMLGSVNDALALARTVKRVYDVVRNYSVERLVADAKRGLYRAMPELAKTEAEVAELIANGKAIEQGEGAFFSRISFHDAAVSFAARASFQHAYQATIWPSVFPDAMSFLPNPSPVELLIEQRYLRTADARRQAVQRTALGVLANKVQAFVDDAEDKDNAELRSLATGAQVNFQTMAHLTEMRNLAEQDAAQKEASRIDDEATRSSMKKALRDQAKTLTVFGGAP